jgi:hypothetical protein
MEVQFKFTDKFEDPLGIGWEPGGKIYEVTGDWTAVYNSEVLKDAKRSKFSVSDDQ